MALFATTAVLLPLASPASATDSPADELTVETYIVPAGTHVPSLEELQSDAAFDSFRSRIQASAEGDAQAAAETTGPAASYDPHTADPSAAEAEAGAGAGTPADDVTAEAQADAADDVSDDPELAAAAAKYPDPPHTMTFDECKNGLGTKNKLFIKSRFAVCTGASFIQFWRQNKKPVGESAFDVRAIGTIAKGSREMKAQVYFSNFAKTGKTATGGLMITPRMTIPKKWPASAKTTQGGSIPGAQSFDALARQKPATFMHSVTVASGQGTTRDDIVSAVYEPAIKIMPPAGWGMTGDMGGKLFFFAPRWDTAKYVTKKGGAVFSNLVALPYSTKAGAPEKAAAEHIRDALYNPGKTSPANPNKNVPGRDPQHPLTRLYHDSKRRNDNREWAKRVCRQVWGNNYPKDPQNPNVKRECDEYPFASTYEGAALRKYVSTAPENNFSARPIVDTENRAGGNILQGFLTKNRIIDGSNDGFMVEIK
ncbi:NucA/NucB deoxyribonuclease domain-containing protein [Streptomyces syringium]|uniref:NucA/NucB deoxyribonuclease domain-containing protein n=1 Tax=Streptomyces syringium TaxID=76729 RepID=UPI00345223C0